MTNTRLLPAYALLALGVLWLLIQIGFVPESLTLALLDWWPLLLIALGLDLIVPAARRGPLPLTLYAAALILLFGVFGVAGRQLTTTQTLQEPLPAGARSLTASLQLGSAVTTLGSAGAGHLVEARFEGSPPGSATVAADGEEATFTLESRNARLFDQRRSRWQVDLTPRLPLDLSVRSGSGRSTLDLTGLDLESLQLDAGSGATELRLPGGGNFYQAELHGGSGRLTVGVEPRASLDLVISSGSGGLRLDVGEGSDLQLVLASRSGRVEIDLPGGAPVRIEAKGDGSGRLTLPAGLTRRSGSGDTGVWQSAAYERGGRVIDITIAAAGSGSITFR